MVFHGGRVSGQYVLFRTGGNQWMIHRMDPPADPDRVPFPGWAAFAPMLTTEGSMPDRRHLKDFAFEIGWGGHRVVTHVEGGRVRMRGSGGNGKLGDTDLIGVVPELRALGLALGTVEVVLDGELIVPGDGGRPDPDPAKRLGAQSFHSTARRLSRTTGRLHDLGRAVARRPPGHDLPFQERRRLLEALAWPARPGRSRRRSRVTGRRSWTPPPAQGLAGGGGQTAGSSLPARVRRRTTGSSGRP